MTYNRGDRDDPRGSSQYPERATGGLIAGFAVAGIFVIGLMLWLLPGDPPNVVRDGVAPPNVSASKPVTAPVAPGTTGTGTGFTRVPGSGQ
jgi:hypothetical protein